MGSERPIGTPLSAAEVKAEETARVEQAKKTVHVQMFAPGVAEAAASIKVTVDRADGAAVLGMLFDYPDMKPAVGWSVVGDGLNLIVSGVDGRTLTCHDPAVAPTPEVAPPEPAAEPVAPAPVAHEEPAAGV